MCVCMYIHLLNCSVRVLLARHGGYSLRSRPLPNLRLDCHRGNRHPQGVGGVRPRVQAALQGTSHQVRLHWRVGNYNHHYYNFSRKGKLVMSDLNSRSPKEVGLWIKPKL